MNTSYIALWSIVNLAVCSLISVLSFESHAQAAQLQSHTRIYNLRIRRLVSSDFIGNKTPTILDTNSTIQLTDKSIKFTLTVV